MTTFDLRRVALRGGEQQAFDVEVELEPLVYGGQEYAPGPNPAPAGLRVTRASSGTVFELDLDLSLQGPCFRCLADVELPVSLRVREYQATNPGGDDELRTEYVEDDLLDLTAWARDAVALSLPDKILCRPECAGLCPVCGKDLNLEPHVHEEEETDSRWSALRSLKDGGE